MMGHLGSRQGVAHFLIFFWEGFVNFKKNGGLNTEAQMCINVYILIAIINSEKKKRKLICQNEGGKTLTF